MALILPKGIVVNSAQINKSIEKIAAEPLDQAEIAKFWKVYTTTKRRLLDPTAERLENYWWRIWYSDKKSLDAATVARLFAHISDGPTFVPLRGPPNREGDAIPPITSKRHGPGGASTTALRQPDQSGQSSGTTTTASSSTTSKNAAPIHPILKKTRGPSIGGPRPTARFISPHESEHEAYDPSSASTNSHVVVQPPSPEPQGTKTEKRTAGSGSKKKTGFTASTKKKRPVIVRRQSSQTSQSSAEAATRGAEVTQAATETLSSLDEPQKPPAKLQSRFQENFSPSPEKSTSSQSSRKRFTDSKRSSPRKSPAGKGRAAPSRLSEEATIGGGPGPSTELRRVENLREDPVEEEGVGPDEREELEMQRILLAEANARVQEKHPPGPDHPRNSRTESVHVLHKSLRSKSAGNIASEGMDAIRYVHHDPKGAPSLAPTLTDVPGQVDIGDTVDASWPSSTPVGEGKGKGRDVEEQKQVDLFAKRPVQPVKATPVADSLSRSKSQLTLLLKQDKEKTSRNKHENEKEKKKKK